MSTQTRDTVLFMQDEWGKTALARACIGDHVATAALLIENGANVEYQDKVKGNCTAKEYQFYLEV